MVQALEEIYRNSELSELTPAALAESAADHRGVPADDPGLDQSIDCGVGWLCVAQDKSASQDGGVAAGYSLLDGWEASYPETTGYIIPTILAYSKLRSNDALRERARRMLDWLVSIQFADGSFPGGTIDIENKVPTVFNTGQILFGLAAGVSEFGKEFYEPMSRAADWLVKVQERDGSWQKYESPLVEAGKKTYSAHVAWGLLEAARVAPSKNYAGAALSNLRWALSQQTADGWFSKCDFDNPAAPITHTLTYAWRGVLEGYIFARDPELLTASRKTAEGFLRAMREDGFIPGRLRSDWSSTVDWACLTGTAQAALCWLLLYRLTGYARYREAAYAANRFVRRTMHTSGPPEVVGGIKGSFPVDGEYCEFSYINWACKFFVDANILEQQIRKEEQGLRGLPPILD